MVWEKKLNEIANNKERGSIKLKVGSWKSNKIYKIQNKRKKKKIQISRNEENTKRTAANI